MYFLFSDGQLALTLVLLISLAGVSHMYTIEFLLLLTRNSGGDTPSI
jgi:hypothetical protein